MSETWVDGFIGDWALDPATCDFQQGDPPLSGRMRIERQGDDLRFDIELVDATGDADRRSFLTRPDGRAEVFDGGDLADALTTRAPVRDVLETAASYRGIERMIVQRSLSVDLSSMTVVQTVILPDRSELVNTSVYRRIH
ncbi:MAG: hypothetical protein GC152_05695 [Alphaproteobacteria bacterium]|nr:hypothetical protein [Alphaproteobacteria bacterium]